MARTIILPREIEDKLQGLTTLKEESNGALLYRRHGELCPVEALYMTGIGSAGHVQSDPKKLEIINGFFKLNPDYKFVKFHTHTVGTIRQYGGEYARKFSAGDIEGIKEQLRYDSEFIAMLATPEARLLSGIDNPQLKIVENCEDYERYHEMIADIMERISSNLGLEHEGFRGTRLS